MNNNNILASVALQNGVTESEVRKSIDEVIKAGLENPDPKVRKRWRSIPHKGKTPTAEEVIDYFVKETRGEWIIL